MILENRKSLSFYIIVATILSVPLAMISVSVFHATTPLVVMIVLTLIGSVVATFFAVKE